MILRPPDWPQFRPPAEQETKLFLGWPNAWLRSDILLLNIDQLGDTKK